MNLEFAQKLDLLLKILLSGSKSKIDLKSIIKEKYDITDTEFNSMIDFLIEEKMIGLDINPVCITGKGRIFIEKEDGYFKKSNNENILRKNSKNAVMWAIISAILVVISIIVTICKK